MRGLPLTIVLRVADLVVRSLPSRAAYAIADLGGRAWHRFSPRRRRLVSESLRRVCEATGRPTDARSMRRLVRRAYVEHARYYLELLRAPHYPASRIGEMVVAEDWEHWQEVLRGGAVVASLHLGNFEPYGRLLAAHGLHAVAPVEEIEPKALFEFILSRRAGGAPESEIELVPLSRSRRRMIETLRAGGVAALIADRDLAGDGIDVSIFGHPATLPAGPAALALMTGRPLLAAACFRIGPDRFRGQAWPIEVERTGDRRADTEALTRELARHYEAAIASAPEQWWGAFQPYWGDQRAAADS